VTAEKQDEKLRIKTIRNGVVIDHIRQGRALDVLRIMGIYGEFADAITLAMNVPSKNLGKKDIVKVENRNIDTSEVNKIAIIAPEATINTIQEYKVVKKEKVSLPDSLVGIIKCPNPQCITNKEREPVKSVFEVTEKDPLVLCCKYCEREISAPFMLT
jgi:aspartate carbamoyltransferase regulatory subunit